MVNNYKAKLDILCYYLVDYIVSKHARSALTRNYIVLDGGECCGKSTAVENIYNKIMDTTMFSAVSLREPTLEAKEKFIKTLEANGSLIEPTVDNVQYITDTFMKDREQVHKQIDKYSIYLSDRSLFSTFVYQSGILSDKVTPEMVEDFCKIIVTSAMKHSILFPSLSVLFGSFDSSVTVNSDSTSPLTTHDGINWSYDNTNSDFIAFSERIDKKKKAGTDNAMDSIKECIDINKVYTDIGNQIIPILNNRYGIYNVISIEHKLTMETICNTIVNHIKVLNIK